jgi:hypothetical protein
VRQTDRHVFRARNSFATNETGAIKAKYNNHYFRRTTLGFDYDWTLRIQVNGLGLANFLNSLALCPGITQVDIEAHSEGVAVTLSAGGQVNTQASSLIQNVVSLAGPINGTPMADFQTDFASVYLNLGPGFASHFGVAVSLLDLLRFLPPLQDLTSTGDPLLPVRQRFARTLPTARLIAVGGYNASLANYYQRERGGHFGRIVGFHGDHRRAG